MNNLFLPLVVQETSKCNECKAPIYDGQCLCGLPEMDYKVYINHCWNCGDTINSLTCAKSLTPGMGYYCQSCGKDLTEWKHGVWKEKLGLTKKKLVLRRLCI